MKEKRLELREGFEVVSFYVLVNKNFKIHSDDYLNMKLKWRQTADLIGDMNDNDLESKPLPPELLSDPAVLMYRDASTRVDKDVHRTGLYFFLAIIDYYE